MSCEAYFGNVLPTFCNSEGAGFRFCQNSLQFLVPDDVDVSQRCSLLVHKASFQDRNNHGSYEKWGHIDCCHEAQPSNGGEVKFSNTSSGVV